MAPAEKERGPAEKMSFSLDLGESCEISKSLQIKMEKKEEDFQDLKI